METQASRRGEVSIRELSKYFALNGRALSVLRGIDLDVESGQCVAIVGASGSGKTTLLRILAGLEAADAGQVLVDGAPIEGVGAERAVIFQEPRLLPWLTVTGDVACPLEVRGVAADDALQRARRYIRLVGLLDFQRPIQPSCREAWLSASGSPVPSRYSRNSFCSTSRSEYSMR
ncbi:ABC transporter ATP-binding protein [Pseudorhizobium endolithicum]|uniref:ABC transporter ATP-binding protein n=1 Tax=Pseudorhizobium endolithicum TaxID=1191678 RepID=A0ABM8PY22_9HYPH|nr:ABC transporter ATP-binding protein [Pseudorhizobium endolithicum]